MFDPINLDEFISYLYKAHNIVFKNDNWIVIFKVSKLIQDNFVHVVYPYSLHGSFVKGKQLRVICRGSHDYFFKLVV